MLRFQSDNGWQTKLIPDSRAIIKLGLGPKQDAADAGQIFGHSVLAGPAQSGSMSSFHQ